jgi:methylmalonyl-CoA/ethylmalonyl-CoA epimerase
MHEHDSRAVAPQGEMANTLASFGAKFDHAAVAARRIRDLLPIYHDLLGGTIANGGDNTRVGYRALQFRYANGHRMELMEPLEGSHFFDSFFERSSLGGLHHVTFKVDDIGPVIEAMRARGYSLTGLFLGDPSWLEVFLHPREAYGTLIQLAQSDGSYEEDESMTLEDILAGHGTQGNGTPSP